MCGNCSTVSAGGIQRRGPTKRDGEAREAFPEETFRRLVEIRRRVDPEDRFLANFPIPLTA